MGVHTRAGGGNTAASPTANGRALRRAVCVLPLLLAVTAAQAYAGMTAARQAELLHLLEQDCGSCHGLTLKGGLGPALTREALAGKPKALLTATILHGRAGTPMPPWRDFVSEAEADWLVDYLQRGTQP